MDIADGSVFNVASRQARSIESMLSDWSRHARVSFEVRVAQDRMRASEIPMAIEEASRFLAAIGWGPNEDWDAALTEAPEHVRIALERSKQ